MKRKFISIICIHSINLIVNHTSIINQKLLFTMPATYDYWPLVLDSLKTNVSGSNFKAWFSRLEFISTTNQGRKIILGVPSLFNKNYIENRYKTELKDAVSKYFPSVIHIDFQVNTPIEAKKDESQQEIIKNLEKHPRLEVTTANAEVVDRLASYLPKKNINNLNPKYTFENFVVAGHNEMAVNVAKAVIDQPGTLYSPVFLYGGVGLGKTHLMQAIGQRMLETHPSFNIKYITSETFLNQFQIALRRREMDEFKNFYRSIDLLLIDDIQFLAGKESTQTEFFHTFNALHQLNKQIILTADKNPSEIKGIEERLLSRFSQGMVVDISHPDLESRIAILNDKVERLNIELTSDQIYRIAAAVDTNIRELEGFLNKIQGKIMFSQNKEFSDLDLETLLVHYKRASDVSEVSSHLGQTEQLISSVCKYFGLEKKDLTGPSRQQHIALARQLLMWFLKHDMGFSYVAIGKLFGGRDHSTVMHATAKIDKLQKNNLQVKEHLESIKQLIAQHQPII
jgi:chromosomal replication initiator protein